MDDAYFLALGFERWKPAFPLQSAMYVHAHVARDGARLYMAVPRSRAAVPADLTSDEQQLSARIERFFCKHGGRRPEAAPEPESTLA